MMVITTENIETTGNDETEEARNSFLNPPVPNSRQIVAVVFGNFNSKTLDIKWNDEPYFYLDLLYTSVGALRLVHTGKEFGVVKVVKVLTEEEETKALPYVTKPLLGCIIYDHDMIRDAGKKLSEFTDRTLDLRIEEKIKAKLGLSQAEQATEAARKNLRYESGSSLVKKSGYYPLSHDYLDD